MDLHRLLLVERLRKEAIGKAVWMPTKHAYEFAEQSTKVVAVLKLVRAAQGIYAMDKLLEAGHMIDFSIAIRCVNDCVEEVYFLLEGYPDSSASVQQFVKAFFETTIDNYLTTETEPVLRKKIRAAKVRFLAGKQDTVTQERLERVFKAFSGYVHANYASTMEVYNGHADDFNLAGVPSAAERENRIPHLYYAIESVLMAGVYIARSLGMKELDRAFMDSLAPEG